MKRGIIVCLVVAALGAASFAPPSYRMARLKYGGGGDWYSSGTALANLAEYCNQEAGMNLFPDEEIVEPGSSELVNYPFVFATGNGNVVFTRQEAENLRKYLIGGGFLHLCDNYGFDKYIRREMKKVFHELEFTELTPSHEIFHQQYDFSKIGRASCRERVCQHV